MSRCWGGWAWVLAMVVGLGVIGGGGCAHGEGGGGLSEPPEQGQPTKRLAAYAIGAKYPADVTPSNELKVTAVVDRAKHTITLRNFGDVTLNDADVWVNGTYVRRVKVLPARGGLVINFAQFYDGRGESLASQGVTVSRVQLAVGKKVYNALGPAYE